MPETIPELLDRLEREHVDHAGTCNGCDGFDWWPCERARVVAHARSLEAALRRIAELDPEKDSAEGWNEWGEAEMFRKAQEIANEPLEDTQMAANRDDALRYAPRRRELE